MTVSNRPISDLPDLLAILPTSDGPDKLALLSSLSGNPARYIAARLRDPEADKTTVLAQLGLHHHTLYRWRTDPSKAALRLLDDAIETGAPMLQAATAAAILLNGAPKAAIGLLDMAESDARTDRQLQVKLQANVKVLEAAGVLKSSQGVTVQIDNRRVDAAALGAWKERRIIPDAGKPPSALREGTTEASE